MKKLMSILLTLAMLCSFAVVPVSAETTLSTQVGEDGKTYYLIGSADDYVAFVAAANADLSINGKLTADIDMSSVTSTANYIGNFGKNKNVGNDKPYTGTFDGNYHVIRNITLKKSLHNDANAGVAMFNMTSGATIKNLGVENATVHNTVAGRSNSYAGVIIAYGQNTVVENCYVKNSTVTWPNSTESDYWAYAGIIAGQLAGTSTKVNNCYSVGNSIGYGNKYNSSGGGAFTGFVGRAETGTITNSYAKGTTVLKGGKFCSFSRVSSAFENCYTDSSRAFSTYSCGANVTEEWSTLADTLGSAFKNDIYELNDGAPRLIWEADNIAYKITAADSIVGGSVSADKEKAMPGETVTLSVTPKSDAYKIATVTVNGEEIASPYTFTMPEGPVTVNATFSCLWGNGDGSASSPFVISTIAELNELRTAINKEKHFEGVHFELANDLDFTNAEFGTIGEIGSEAEKNVRWFSGSFDGKNHIVKNLTIDTSRRFVALFGQVKNATIKNLGIESSTFRQQGNYYAAGIAGIANNSEISGCFVKNTTMNVKCASGSNGQYAGGIVAQGIGATTISDCYVKGITLKTETSGIYFNGAAGGIAGGVAGTSQINNCYASGVKFTNAGSNIANIARVSGSAVITNAFAESTQKRDSDSVTVIAAGSDEWLTLANTLGSAWENDTNNLNGGTPMLKWELESILNPSLPFAPDNYDGEGTKEDPFLINNLDDLKTLSKDVKDGYTFTGRYFRLTADIDMHTKDNTEENAWIPIGSSKERSFGGVFDGNGKVIKNVYITQRQGNMGFFGFLYGAEVKNLGIEKIKFEYTNDSDARVSYVGGLAGTINDSTVDSCYVHDFVNINHKDNVNEGHVGPLAGYAYDALVSNCFTVNMTWSGSPDAKVSGFIGSLNGSDSNKTVIKNCYSAGNFVFGTKTKNFWLMGRITKTANVKKAENCYFSHGIPQKKGTSTNNDLGDKGCVKLTDAEMQNAIEGLGAEYRKADGGHENYGYPMLSWMSDVPLEYYPVTIEIVGKGSCEINTSMLKDGNQVAYNSYVSLGIDPAMGYKFKEIFLNGYLIEYDYLPSFKMGRAPALLTLEFEEIEIPDVAPGYIYKHEGISDADVIDDEHFAPASGLINGVFATVPEKGEKTNNVIKVVPQSGSNSNYFNYYPEGGFKFPYSDFTLEYDVYVENIKNSSYVGADSSDISDNVIHKLETTRSDGQHMASFSFIQDEYDEMYAVFEDSESTEKIALKTDIWYHVVMAIDPQSGKHDVNVINRSNGKIAGRLIYTTEKTAQSDKGVGISFHAGYCSDGMPESERNCYYLDNLKYSTNKFYMPDEKAEVTKSGDSVKFSLPTYLNVPSATETRTPVMIASVFDKNGKLLVGADLSKAVLDAQSSEITGSASAQYENLSGEINISSLADGKYDVKVFVWFNLFDDNAQVPYFEVLNDSITVSNGSIVSE